MCQKLWKMIESRQSYCKESCVQFFGPPCIIFQRIWIHITSTGCRKKQSAGENFDDQWLYHKILEMLSIYTTHNRGCKDCGRLCCGHHWPSYGCHCWTAHPVGHVAWEGLCGWSAYCVYWPVSPSCSTAYSVEQATSQGWRGVNRILLAPCTWEIHITGDDMFTCTNRMAIVLYSREKLPVELDNYH